MNLNNLIGTEVQVYKNINRERQGFVDCWSIKAKEADGVWRVVGYCSDITLDNVAFRYSETRRQAVIESGHKEVHAWVHGTVVAMKAAGRRFSYDPRSLPWFFDKESREELLAADVKVAVFTKGKSYYKRSAA